MNTFNICFIFLFTSIYIYLFIASMIWRFTYIKLQIIRTTMKRKTYSHLSIYKINISA